jgi:NADPH-dependent curcumin reductase CurA
LPHPGQYTGTDEIRNGGSTLSIRDKDTHYSVHVIEGLKNAPAAMNMLFDGHNHGKLIIKI